MSFMGGFTAALIIDRGSPWFDLLEGRYRGPLADMGTARNLAVAIRTRQDLLRGRAGFCRNGSCAGCHPGWQPHPRCSRLLQTRRPV